MKRAVMIVACLLVAGLVGIGLWLYTPDKSRADLEAAYTTGPGDLIVVAGTRLHVRDTGPRDGPALVLIHGFGSSLHTWEAWARNLSADHRVIRFDLPGAGLSEPDPTGDYSDRRSLAVLGALLDRLGVAQASLVGNSIGGRIAWMMAAAHPERVAKLVLISPDGFASPGFEYGKAPAIPSFVKVLPYVLPTRLVRMSLAPAYGDPERLSDAVVTRYRDMMLAPGVRDAMIARMAQSVREDPEPLLRAIVAPTLLVWGERDRLIPFTNAQDYLRLIRGSVLAPFPGLGHVPQEEAPDVTLAAVRAFLRSPP